MSRLSFSFPIDAEASFILTRYLEELEQRVLLSAALSSANQLEEKITPERIFDAIRERITHDEYYFLDQTLNPRLEQEWKTQPGPLDKTQQG